MIRTFAAQRLSLLILAAPVPSNLVPQPLVPHNTTSTQESLMPLPPSVADIVDRFSRNAETYTAPEYNETQLRREFLDPLFEALGWDLTNKLGYADAYKDVIHEDSIKVSGPGGGTKAPDYCFRIGGTRKFFLEAKKPSIDVKGDPNPAYQLRRYAWSAKLPVSVLSDFEEFAIYDTRIKPDLADKASAARIFYCRYTDYAEKWDQIAAILSKDAILKGAFDKYAEGTKSKRGTAEVDDAFLQEIESWRNDLAENIALRNASLSERDLNLAVTRTIDRIVFLRICEDRGIEQYAQLQTISKVTDIYGELLKLFRRADEKYNSGLFHFTKEKDRPEEPDTLTPSLDIDDKTLRPILASLYYPDCPYEFSVLPADILGHVYEQFLGKIIRLTPAHRAKIEEKPEVRKAGGVYYTPTYIVDYIVQNTLGKLLGDRNAAILPASAAPADSAPPAAPLLPKDAAKLKILDPACGSGSFLLGAYQYLLDWHLRYYLAHDPDSLLKSKNPPIYAITKSHPEAHPYRLTLGERKRILLNNIYGVDIDQNAVETTKLSLLLEALRGESDQSITNQLKLFRERALPDLAGNVKCGNSLIANDYYARQQMSLLDEELRYRVNAFDWDAPTGFAKTAQSGGFDVVIGNPPWGANIDNDLEYLHLRYPRSTNDHTDSFKLFIDKAVSLTKANGRTAMIVPNTLLRQRRIKDARNILLENTLETVADLGEDVFLHVVAPSCIFVLHKMTPGPQHKIRLISIPECQPEAKARLLIEAEKSPAQLVQADVSKNAEFELMARTTSTADAMPLGDFAEFKLKDAGINYQRVGTGMQQKGNSDLAERLLYEGQKARDIDQMYWKGTDINRYTIAQTTTRFCRPDFQKFIRNNEVVRLAKDVFEATPKILIRQTADRPIATMDTRGVWFGRSIIAILRTRDSEYSLFFLLGLLNSKYVNYVYATLVNETGRVFAQVKLSKLKQLPIRKIDFTSPHDRHRHDELAQLVDTILTLHQQLAKAKSGREQIQRQIDATDKQIDALVYQLYNLTPEEIQLVEAATGSPAPAPPQ
jgi:hypothetical protein